MVQVVPVGVEEDHTQQPAVVAAFQSKPHHLRSVLHLQNPNAAVKDSVSLQTVNIVGNENENRDDETRKSKVCQSLLFVIASICILLLQRWSIEYVVWNVSTQIHSHAALQVNFKKNPECIEHGNYFVQEIESIDVLGGTTSYWEDVVKFPDSLTRKEIFVNHNNYSYVAVEASLVFWLPSWVLRALSLNTLSRTEHTVALYLNEQNKSSENGVGNCLYRFTHEEASHVSLIDYLMQAAGQADVKIFSKSSYDQDTTGVSSSSSSLSSSNSYNIEWACPVSTTSKMISPQNICTKDEKVSLVSPTNVAFLVIWGIVVVTVVIAFSVFVYSSFIVSKIHTVPVENDSGNSKPIKGEQTQDLFGGNSSGFKPAPGKPVDPLPPSKPPSDKKEKTEEEKKIERRQKINLFVNIFGVMFAAPKTEKERKAIEHATMWEISTYAAKQFVIIMIPILIPCIISTYVGCDMGEADCDRKETIQLPLFRTTLSYLMLFNVYLIGSVWNIFPGNIYRYLVRSIVFFLSLFSVGFITTNILWMLLACTVRPIEAGSKIIAIISIIIYARQTWRKLLNIRLELIKRLKDAGLDAKATGKELELHGFTKRQLRSFVWVTSGVMSLVFAWLVVCAIIFYSGRTGSDSGFFSFLFGFLFPFVTSVTHVVATLKQRNQAEAIDPLSNTLQNEAIALEDANLSNDLKKLADEFETVEADGHEDDDDSGGSEGGGSTGPNDHVQLFRG